MRGLDPRIHDALQPSMALPTLPALNVIVDCRVKPGNDSKNKTLHSRSFRGALKALSLSSGRATRGPVGAVPE